MTVRARPLLPILAAVLLAACSPRTTPSGTNPSASIPASQGSPTPVSLTVGLGYLPSVQFAPFYLAQQNGYYAQAGLQVTFRNKIDPDLVTLVGQGAIDVGVADGTSVIPAVSQGIPIKYVATIYGRYPSIVFAKASAGIEDAAGLKGRKIGIPGRYGSSWIMLQALLGSANLTPEDVTVVLYPEFTQGAALQQGLVDAATGFVNNEPVQAKLAGIDVSVLHVDDVVALPGPGLIAGTAALTAKRDAIEAFVAATLRAMTEIADNPQKGLDASFAVVPDLATTKDTQLAILVATIRTWARNGANASSFGAIDTAGWQASIAYMTKLGLVPKPVTVADLVLTDFVPGASPAP